MQSSTFKRHPLIYFSLVVVLVAQMTVVYSYLRTIPAFREIHPSVTHYLIEILERCQRQKFPSVIYKGMMPIDSC